MITQICLHSISQGMSIHYSPMIFLSRNEQFLRTSERGERGSEVQRVRNAHHFSHFSRISWDMRTIVFFLITLSVVYAANIHGIRQKRPDFMGQSVNMLQYVRLTQLQDAAIRADRYMKNLARTYGQRALLRNPQWRELASLYNSLSELVPQHIKE